MFEWMLHWKVNLPGAPLLKLMLAVHGPLQVFVWATPGRLTPKSWGTLVSLLVKLTVTWVLAGTAIDWRSKVMLVATTARVTGALPVGGAAVGCGAVVGCGAGADGWVGAGAAVGSAAAVGEGTAVSTGAATAEGTGEAEVATDVAATVGAAVPEGDEPSELLHPAARRATANIETISLTMLTLGEV